MATKELMTVTVGEEDGKLMTRVQSASGNMFLMFLMLRNSTLVIEALRNAFVEAQRRAGGNVEDAEKFFDTYLTRVSKGYLQKPASGHEEPDNRPLDRSGPLVN